MTHETHNRVTPLGKVKVSNAVSNEPHESWIEGVARAKVVLITGSAHGQGANIPL